MPPELPLRRLTRRPTRMPPDQPSDPPPPDLVEIRTTFASRAAAEACAAWLVAERVAACVQIDGPVTSVYRWQAAVETATEWRCTAKTSPARAAACRAALVARHEYQTPEIISAVAHASAAYAAWVRASVADWYAFEITLHPRPAVVQPAADHLDAWGTWPTLDVPPAVLAAPLTAGFDDVLERLARLERMFVEPDGAIVWKDAVGGHDWQVDGNAWERDGRLAALDLKGRCPPAAFEAILAACGWPAEPLLVELVRAGVVLDLDTFRSHAAARATAESR
jgi:periplasmic divalent cation tolerance protein